MTRERLKAKQDRIKIALKEAILLAAEEAGDAMAEKEPGRPEGLVGYLLAIATADPKAFCGLLGRVLPMQVTGAGDGPIVVEILRLGSNASHPTA